MILSLLFDLRLKTGPLVELLAGPLLALITTPAGSERVTESISPIQLLSAWSLSFDESFAPAVKSNETFFGKGPSVLKCTKQIVNQHDEIAICNYPVLTNFFYILVINKLIHFILVILYY